MSFRDIFYSPEIIPYKNIAKNNSGIMAILIERKKPREESYKEVAVAKTKKELIKIIKELRRNQIIMGLRFKSNGDPVEMSRPYIKHLPLQWNFKIEDGKVANRETGESLPLTNSF